MNFAAIAPGGPQIGSRAVAAPARTRTRTRSAVASHCGRSRGKANSVHGATKISRATTASNSRKSGTAGANSDPYSPTISGRASGSEDARHPEPAAEAQQPSRLGPQAAPSRRRQGEAAGEQSPADRERGDRRDDAQDDENGDEVDPAQQPQCCREDQGEPGVGQQHDPDPAEPAGCLQENADGPAQRGRGDSRHRQRQQHRRTVRSNGGRQPESRRQPSRKRHGDSCDC